MWYSHRCEGCISLFLNGSSPSLFTVSQGVALKNLECRISVIIPVFCESTVINGTIESVRFRKGGKTAEIIVVDGQAEGETVAPIQAKNRLLFSLESAITNSLSRRGEMING